MEQISVLQPLITCALDVAVIVVLLVLCIRVGKQRTRVGDICQIRDLERSLQKTLADSVRLTDELSTRFDETMKELTRLLQRLDAKGKRLAASIARAEEMATVLDRQHDEPVASTEPYQRAITLIEQGAADEDIHRQSGISREEIRLMRQLYQVRQRPDA